MGVTTWGADEDKHFGLSLTLGGAETRPIDMAQVYATFANNGLENPLVAITRMVDAEGNVLEDYKVPQGEQVVDPRAAYMITNILSDPNAKLFTYGPNTPLMLHQNDDPKGPLWPAASKTGTTDNYRDTWTDGYTPDLAIVVWVGNADGHPMHQTLSTLTAAKVWPASMKMSFDYWHLQSQEFPRPEGLVERQVCGDTRLRPGAPLCWNDLFFTENAPRGTVQAGPLPPRPTAQPARARTPSRRTGSRRPAQHRPRRRSPPRPVRRLNPSRRHQRRPGRASPDRRAQAAGDHTPGASGQADRAARRPRSHRQRPSRASAPRGASRPLTCRCRTPGRGRRARWDARRGGRSVRTGSACGRHTGQRGGSSPSRCRDTRDTRPDGRRVPRVTGASVCLPGSRGSVQLSRDDVVSFADDQLHGSIESANDLREAFGRPVLGGRAAARVDQTLPQSAWVSRRVADRPSSGRCPAEPAFPGGSGRSAGPSAVVVMG